MYFSHLIVGGVGLCFNRGLGTGRIAVRIGNSSSEGVPVGCRAGGDIHGNLCKINPVLSPLVFVPRLTTPSNYEFSFIRPWYSGKIPLFVDAVRKRRSPCCVYFVLPCFRQNCIWGSDPCVRVTRLLAGVRYSRLLTTWLTTWSSERNRVFSRSISQQQAVAAAG
jgi:hypothetical protein